MTSTLVNEEGRDIDSNPVKINKNKDKAVITLIAIPKKNNVQLTTINEPTVVKTQPVLPLDTSQPQLENQTEPEQEEKHEPEPVSAPIPADKEDGINDNMNPYDRIQ